MMLYAATALSQTETYDSLKTRLNDIALPDTARLQTLLQLGQRTNTYAYPDTTLKYFKEHEGLLKSSASPEDVFWYNYNFSLALYLTSQYELSIDLLQEQRLAAMKAFDTMKQIRCLTLMGNNYLEMGDMAETIYAYSETRELSKSINFNVGVNIAESNLAIAYTNLKYYDKALALFQEELARVNTSEAPEKSYFSYTNIGRLYKAKGQFEKALGSHLTALELISKSKDSLLLATILLNLSDAYKDLADQKNYQKFLFLGEEAATKNGTRRAYARSRWMLGEYFLLQNELDSALAYGNEALVLAKEFKKKEMKVNALKVVQSASEKKGDFSNALAVLKEIIETNDSINSRESQYAISRLDLEAKQLKQEFEAQAKFDKQVADYRLRSYSIIFVTLAFSIVAILGIYSFFRARKVKAEYEKNLLLKQFDLLKQRIATRSISTDDLRKDFQLDKEKIEVYLGSSLGQSSWMILEVLFKEPSIRNKDLAKAVHLSEEGVSSSLRRMYKSFDIHSENRNNLKIALLKRVIEISIGAD